MNRATILVACLAVACSGGQDGNADHTTAPPKKPAAHAPASTKGTTDPLPVTPARRRGYDPPLLFVKDRGIHFEILDLDDLPYDGKIVTYHDLNQKIVKTEKIYKKGKLNAEREFWPNAKPKLEISYSLGNTTTNRYDQLGNEIKPPPPTRSYNWTYNYKGGKAHLETFIGRDLGFLTKYLGEPNIKLNNIWTYRNMRIFDGLTGRQHTAVRFTISGNTVSSAALVQ